MRGSILVVDDDPAIVALLTDGLEAAGYKVTSALDGAQAVIQAKAVRPGLVICDIQMPVWGSGVEVHKNIRATAALKETPVIFLTGMTPQEAKKLMPEDPKIRLLAKPLNWTMLEQAIAELLGESRTLGGP